jgi:hypothetical protein
LRGMPAARDEVIEIEITGGGFKST